MKIEIKVPSLGESISEATIGQVFVKNGRHVAADAEILELETDKVNQVLYAPQTGIINISVKPDETVKIGQVIGSLEPLGENLVKTDEGSKQEDVHQSQENTSIPAVEVKQMQPIRKTKESFVAELSQNPVSKATHVELPQECERPASAKNESSSIESETRKPLSKIRRVIAKRLLEAQQTTAMLTTFNEVDLSQVILLRERYQETFTKKYGTKLGFMSFFVEAVTSALKAFPTINSFIDGDDLVLRNYFNIGVAVGTDKGTFVPVLRECDKMSFGQIESTIASFAKKAREGKLVIEDLQGGGFTITNGGVYGSLLSTPILNPPQSAILGMHKIEKRPVVVDDQIVIRPMMYLALSYDHRIVDGKESVSFLVHIKNDLEDPARLLLDV